MRYRMSTQIASLFLLVVSAWMFYPLPIVNAQSRSRSIGLEGTEWQGAPSSYAVGSAIGTLQCVLIFESQGKALHKCLAIQSPGTMAGTNLNNPMYLPGVDNPYTPRLVITPGGTAASEAVGKYTQTGNSIRVEFSDAILIITLKDDVMFGETIYNDTRKGREKWVMQKIQNDRSSEQASSPLSLSEFQKRYFKPIPLSQNSISGTNLDGTLNYHNYSCIVDAGELTITLVLKASPDSFASQVAIEVQDRKNNVLGGKFITTARGRTDQASVSVKLSEKQAVLLKVRVSGGASYQIQLNGALDFGQPASSSGLDAIARSQLLIREETERELREGRAREKAAIEKLSTLGTYKAATEITYGGTKISGTLVIKVIAVGSGKVVVEVEGENGISLKGFLAQVGFSDNDLVLRGIVSIDFGAVLGTQKLDFALGFNVEDRALTHGRFFIGDRPDFEIPNGKFSRAELVTAN